MDSSTSHSKAPSVPWRAVQLAAVALGAWAIGAAYSLRGNPEIAFFRREHALKREWAASALSAYTNKVVVCGGSSCATSLDPGRLLSVHGLPVENAGLGAIMGARLLTRYGLDLVRTGDTLIVALEPDLLAGPIELEPLGVQFALAVGRPGWLRGAHGVNWPSALLDLRPGGQHTFALLGKILLRQPLYRYAISELQPGGWHRVAARRDLGTPAVPAMPLSSQGRALLQSIRDECQRRQVRVACVVPWQFCLPENERALRHATLGFLRQVADVLPVLQEPSMGTHAVRDHFADTVFHLRPEIAAQRTDEFAEALKAWRLWSVAAMDVQLAAPN